MAVIIKTPGPAEDYHSGWSEIVEGQIVIIKDRKQMIIYQELNLEGELEILGELIVL